MKTAKYLFVALGLLLLITSCFLSNPGLNTGKEDSAYLPPDTINDASRSFDGPFQYETLLPVDLDLEVTFFEQDPVAGGALREVAPDTVTAVVTLSDSEGNVVFEAGLQQDGTLDAQLALPAALEDMELTVRAQGYESRSVTIPNLVQYFRIERKMGLLSQGPAAKGQIMPDSDGDGIPDVYDAFPNDPNYAFKVEIPGDEEVLTVAFEDLYLVERAGDADYNDFVATYTIDEVYGADPPYLLDYIEITATAVQKLAGYNHLFGIAIGYEKDDPNLKVTIEVDYPGIAYPVKLHPYENICNPPDSTFKNKAIVPLFLSTEHALGKTTSVTVNFGTGIERDKVELAPFDPFLYVYNTQYDIHLIGKDPLPEIPYVTKLKSDAGGMYNFMDDEGFPWALLIPTDWEHPAETQFIEEVYPFFKDWREDNGASNSDWYLRRMDPNNQPPEAPSSPNPSALEFEAGQADEQEETLRFKLGKDPEGGQVTLHYSDLPDYITMDPIGDQELSVKVINAPVGELTVYFWCEDDWGARSDLVPMTITFVEASQSYDRILIDTFSPDGSLTARTYLDLFGPAGDPDADDPWLGDDTPITDAIAYADDADDRILQQQNKMMASIIYTGQLPPDLYYIRVRGETEDVHDFYAIRVHLLKPGQPIPDYTYPGTDYARPDIYEDDDYPRSGGIPSNPIPIADGQTISRSLDYTAGEGDVDWFELDLR